MALETSKEPGIFISWKVIAVAVLLAVGIYYFFHQPSEQEPVHWMSIADGEKEWQKGQKPILYDFCAAWCGPCNAMKEEVFGDRATAEKINQFFIPVRVMDRSREDGRNSDEVQALDMKYGLQAFPTLVVRMPGDKSQIQVGYSGREMTIRFLQGALALWNQANPKPNS
jgi:thiol:disulfide interchange protein